MVGFGDVRRRERGVRPIAVRTALVLLACTAALTGVVTRPAPAQGALGTKTPHLAVILMENKEYSQVVGNANAPYLNTTLIPAGRLFSKYYAATHPSLPGYLVLTSGQYGGCVTDTCPTNSLTSDNLFAQMNRATVPVSWKVYAEGMPANCYRANKGGYLARHNPALYYTSLSAAGDGSCATNDVPYSGLATDMAAGTLPDFSFIVPNQYNDMHTDRSLTPCQLGGPVQNQICQGDAWLRDRVPALLSDGGRNDVTVVVVFDEGATGQGGGGNVMLLEAGPATCQACTDATPFNAYGLLESVERWFGLPALGPASGDL